jgi:hypothetical protein
MGRGGAIPEWMRLFTNCSAAGALSKGPKTLAPMEPNLGELGLENGRERSNASRFTRARFGNLRLSVHPAQRHKDHR